MVKRIKKRITDFFNRDMMQILNDIVFFYIAFILSAIMLYAGVWVITLIFELTKIIVGV